MISKTCYKPHNIFIWLPIKDSLCIDIVLLKLTFCVHCRSEKKHLREQFISLVQIPFYVIYFPESASYIPSRQNMFYVSIITLEKRSNGLNNLVDHNLSRC